MTALPTPRAGLREVSISSGRLHRRDPGA